MGVPGRRAIAPLGLVAGLAIAASASVLGRDGHDRPDPSAVRLTASVRELLRTMPQRGSEAYDRPSEAEAEALALAFAAASAGRAPQARALAQPLGYELRAATEPAGAVILLEPAGRRAARSGSGPDAQPGHGWGLYVHAPGSRRPVVVEVTHPLADRGTARLGLELFTQAEARVLLVAGAHRGANADGSADVADTKASAFEAVHRVVARPGTVLVQLHGFDGGERPGEYGDVVLSSGTTRITPTVSGAADALRAAGFEVCEFDGERCSQLGATGNVQGDSARAAGAEFLHVELSGVLRDDPAVRRRAIAALAAALG